MPTDKPRIQAYIEPRLHEKFKEFQQERGLKESPALNALLGEFFKTESIDPASTHPPFPTEDIEKIVRDEVSSLFRGQMEQNADFWLNRLSERVATVEKSLEKFVNLSYCQVDELKNDLGERLAACEDSLEALLESDSPDSPRSPESTARHENLTPLPEPISTRVIEYCERGKVQEAEALSELPSEPPSDLNLSQLARHLKISKSVISRRKTQMDFERWSRSKDPNGTTWSYDPERQIFRGIAL